MIKNSKIADLALITTAIIWGTGFIGTEYAIATGAKTSLIITMRFLIAGILLGVCYFKHILKIDKETFKTGFVAGFLLFAGFYLQTFGQSHTNVSNSSFLTSTNVIMIPFIIWIFAKKPPQTKYFVLGFTALIGIAILTLNFKEGMTLKYGDIFVLLSAVCFALHIAYLGVAGQGKDSKALTFLQMIINGILALIFMLIFDREALDFGIALKALPSTAFLAVFCSCVCYYFQTTAQQYTSPAKAGIILCTEGFFGSVFAIILGIDTLTASIVIGGTIILSSVILAEVDIKLPAFLKIKNK